MDLKSFKGAVFDLDGTLLDSMHVWENVDKNFLKKRGIQVPDDYNQAVKNMYFPTAAKYTKERFGLVESEEEIMKEWTLLCLSAYRTQVRLKAGVFEYLSGLSKKGIKIAYATANEEALCDAVLSSNKIDRFFSARAYSAEVGKNKSEPDIYLLAAERLGLKPEECMVFEDILMGINGAKKGGFSVCGVYDATSERETALIKERADYYINSFTELL